MEQIEHSTKKLFYGLFYIIGGSLLLLHTLGFLQKGVSTLLILLSLVIIIYGLLISGFLQMIINAMRKK